MAVSTWSSVAMPLVELCPAARSSTAPAAPPLAVEVALVTDDVQAAYDTATKAGATAHTKPAKTPWGQTVAYVRDNNGFLVEICTPVG